jgi:hypothetical protein
MSSGIKMTVSISWKAFKAFSMPLDISIQNPRLQEPCHQARCFILENSLSIVFPAILNEAVLTGSPRTLCKINSFVEVQRDGNKIKHFFRQSEMNTLLKQCHTGLEQAVEAFKVIFLRVPSRGF